ncbi:MAG TPA: oxidoreductase [Opitutaceae bacterium]
MSLSQPWRIQDMRPQNGILAVITGATGGIGYQTALALAAAGADVVIAARSREKAHGAMARIARQVPDARLRFEELDLATLESVRAFAARVASQHRSLDLLINNAAVMTPPRRLLTPDGFEIQFGTNYLSHFALTGLLLPVLQRARGPRVVTLSSIAARSGAIDFGNLYSEKSYKPMVAYAQSKLACLLFAFELQRRSQAGGWGLTSIAAHPGISRTDLLYNGAGRTSAAGLARRFLWFLFQPAAQGALPGLFAATSPEALPGHYYGPAKLGETRGHPKSATPPRQSLDTTTAARLWVVSEQLTGVHFP